MENTEEVEKKGGGGGGGGGGRGGGGRGHERTSQLTGAHEAICEA